MARDSHGKRLESRSERDPSAKRSRREENHEDDDSPSESKRKLDSADKELKKNETDLPRSRSRFQHREHGGEERGFGRDYSRRATDSRAPRTPWNRNPNRPEDRVWRHDRFYELESGARRRPAFREIKAPARGDAADLAEFSKPFRGDRGAENRNWREDQRHLPWGESRRREFHPRERRIEGNRQAPFAGNQPEKWKHDLFDDGYRSPPPKNEEDEIAKLEALLSS